MATMVENPFDTQQAAPTNTGIIGGTVANMDTGSPANTGFQQYNPTPVAQPQTYTAQTREVNAPTDTVQGQVNSILSKDSPLMQRARTLATQQMAQRGLVNSSMNAGAGVAAMTDRAMQMGAQDAQTYSNRSLANMEATNQAGMFNTGQSNDLFKFGQDVASRYGMQDKQQQFESGQNELQRDFQMRVAQLEQSGMDRRQAEEVASRFGLQAGQQSFQAGQSALDRSQQTGLQSLQQQFQAAQASLDRAQQVSLTDKSISAQENLQRAQQAFQGAQSELDRAQQFGVLGAQQQFQAREAELERAGVNNRFDRELALKSDTFNVEQINADRRLIQQNEYDLQKLNLQINANTQNIPTAFAANISNTTMQGVNGILADGNLTPEAKTGAINNLITYANSQIAWAERFYATTIPRLSAGEAPASTPAPVAAAPAPTPVAAAPAPAPAVDPVYQRFLDQQYNSWYYGDGND
jgi:hypothetical protein